MQAPQRRRDERPGGRRRALLVAAAVALAAALAAAAFFLLRDDEDATRSVREAMQAARCTFEEKPALPAATHISDPDGKPKEWNTDPPTTGPHFEVPAIWGEYEEPLQPARIVHNLEHGGIAMYYGDDVPDAQIEELRRFYRDDPTAMLLSPLPKLGDKIALTAWYAPVAEGPGADEDEEGDAAGVLAQCERFDEDAFETFRDTYRYKGPERFPPEALEPGM